jgi:hypothetical protein
MVHVRISGEFLLWSEKDLIGLLPSVGGIWDAFTLFVNCSGTAAASCSPMQHCHLSVCSRVANLPATYVTSDTGLTCETPANPIRVQETSPNSIPTATRTPVSPSRFRAGLITHRLKLKVNQGVVTKVVTNF